MGERTSVNGLFWEEISPHPAASDQYDLESFLAGTARSAVELAEVGGLAGKEMVHVQRYMGLDSQPLPG